MRPSLFAPLLLALFAAAPAPAQVTVTPVASPSQAADGDPILLPQGPAQAVVATYEIAPGAALPVHRHPHPRMAYVLSGELVVTATATGAETSYAAGEFVVEMVGDWHFGRNPGEAPLLLLVIDLVPVGEGNTELAAP